MCVERRVENCSIAAVPVEQVLPHHEITQKRYYPPALSGTSLPASSKGVSVSGA